MKGVRISVIVPEEVLEKLKGYENRSAFILEAINEKLKSGGMKVQNRDALKNRLDDLLSGMDLSGIDAATAVRLRISMKEAEESDSDREALSLRSSLERMPQAEDLTLELKRVKGLLYKTERERDMNKALVNHGKGFCGLEELMGVVFRGAVEYSVDLIARDNLPGFGDGGGLSDKGYSDIAAYVKKMLEGMQVAK